MINLKLSYCLTAIIAILFKAHLFAESINSVIIYTEEDIPYVTIDQEGLIKGGIATEKMLKVLQKLNLPKKIIEIVPWARAYYDATSKPNIIIYPIVKTPERLEKLDFLFKLLDSNVYIYKLKSRKDIKIKKLNDAKKYSICVVRNDYRAEYLKKEEFKFLDESSDSSRNVKKFVEARCDLIISTEIGIQGKMKALKYEYSLVQKLIILKNLDSALYAAINKNTDNEIKEQFKKAASSIK